MTNHLLSINDFSKQEILNLIEQTAKIKANPNQYTNKLKNKIIAALFFEPSTRTRLSFESAALRLGAKVLGFADATSSSTKKGETLEDTIKVINNYADIIAMRHSEKEAAKRVAKVSKVPIINAGDGINEHPTQALLDIFTIAESKNPKSEIRNPKSSYAKASVAYAPKLQRRSAGRQIQNSNDQNSKPFDANLIENLKIAFVGDLKFGRTVHSLSQGLTHFNPIYYLISPKTLKLPNDIKKKLEKQNIAIQELETWDDIANEIDILYMTRVQKERFTNPAEYERLKNTYILNKQTAQKFKNDCLFMHPLPRVGEIDPEIDNDPRAIYFEQAGNGVWIRMAILIGIMNQE